MKWWFASGPAGDVAVGPGAVARGLAAHVEEPDGVGRVVVDAAVYKFLIHHSSSLINANFALPSVVTSMTGVEVPNVLVS